MNRKLIRPHLAEVKESGEQSTAVSGGKPDSPRFSNNDSTFDLPTKADKSSRSPLAAEKGRRPPAADTSAEIFYYKKQIDSHTNMIIVLQDGEEITGTIEWYDRNALKINRKNAPNILLLKHNIKYMFKAEDKNSAANGSSKN